MPARRLTASAVLASHAAMLCGIVAPAKANPAVTYGQYEDRSLRRALEQLGLTIETNPEGKVLRKIHVVNENVFSSEDGFLRWLNIFHRTTRGYISRREVVLQPGEVWNQTKIMQTARRLRDSSFTTLAVVVPVEAPEPKQVDMLIVTRDVWSLRFNSDFEIQQQTLTELSLSLSENNMLGWRKQFAAVFDMDQGKYSIGPLYVDKNIAGTRLELKTSAGAIFGRASQQLEGSQSYTRLTYPLWSVDSDWGAKIRLRHSDSIVRSFEGTELRRYDAPETAQNDFLPYEYRHQLLDLESEIVHSQGDDLLHRFSFGHQLHVSQPSLLHSFPANPVARDSFIRSFFPRSERTSTPYIRYELYPPRFVTYHSISSYDLSEDAQLGPAVEVEFGSALTSLGSTNNHIRLSAAGTYTRDLRGDGFLRVGGTGHSRFQSGELVDNMVSASVELAAPRHWLGLRLVVRGEVGKRFNEKAGRFFTVGGQTGLRGYPIGAFIGQTQVLGNVEIRSASAKVFSARLGALVFYDVGHAANSIAQMCLRQDAGIGLRLLFPQLSPLVHRLDWAIPFNVVEGLGAGLPGRVTIGLGQVF